MSRTAEVLTDTVKHRFLYLFFIVASQVGSCVVFYLYGLPMEPFYYALLITASFTLLLFAASLLKGLAKAKRREQMLRSALTEPALPTPDSLSEQDYQAVLFLLKKEISELRAAYEAKLQEENDYYTAWVHQIKTPISVMRMELGNCDAKSKRQLETELFRIEQYADMVLQYIRLDSDSNDLVIREYSLDDLIRETVRKFAPQFIAKRLSLHYDGTKEIIVTDSKWFACILEQILSNAIKYTSSGGITITVCNGLLQISDTGIGIASEDVPRIFEKGFTGENGRLEKRSSGLGLYLCKKAAQLLQIPLSVRSTLGKGSTFSLDLSDKIPH